MKYSILFTLLLLLGLSGASFGSVNTNDELESYFQNLKSYEFNEALKIAESSKLSFKEDLILFARLLKYNGYPLSQQLNNNIEGLNLTDDQDKIRLTLFYLIKGYHIMANPNLRSDAFELLIKAKELSEEIDNIHLLKFSLLGILRLYRNGVLHPDDMFRVYLEEYKALCEDPVDFMHYYSLVYRLYNQISIYEQDAPEYLDNLHNMTIKSMDSLKELIPITNKTLIHYYSDKASYSSGFDFEAAEDYYLKALEYADTSTFFRNHRFNIILHLARIKNDMGQYQEALDYANESIKYLNPNDSLKHSFFITGYKGDIHANLKNYDSAFINIRDSRYLEYQLDFQRENAQIAKLEIENKTQQKEVENLELKAKNSRNRTLLIAALAIMFFGGIVAILIQKNTKRKQLLAENEKNLQNQKLAIVLKEQELKSIDAMIEGQEKERQRIASDLHDDLGSVMTNLKLHINALKDTKSDELYIKADQLVEEAYNKVRLVSHAKNSGVMAKEGLLKAIKKMAANLSLTSKIDIHVVYHGLEERLENSLELTIFRIVQELITNILKHAEATEVTINLIQHEDQLNIMVEDDGKGFVTSKVTTTNSGMGLNSIDKRVEHLNGELTIESELGKGTTIIIDIPI